VSLLHRSTINQKFYLAKAWTQIIQRQGYTDTVYTWGHFEALEVMDIRFFARIC
jgi:hypothetical protein